MPQILPPDPEEMNDQRAEWADTLIAMFRQMTGCSQDEALGDILANLRHACDRDPELGDFEGKVESSRDCYRAEIAYPGTEYAGDPALDAEYAAYAEAAAAEVANVDA